MLNKLFIILFSIFSLVYSQNNSLLYSVPSNPDLQSNLNNELNNYSFNQSFSFINVSSSAMGTNNIGVLSNYLNYQLSKDVHLHSSIHLLSGTSNYQPGNHFNIQYDVGMEYKLSDNTTFNIRVSNAIPSYGNSMLRW